MVDNDILDIDFQNKLNKDKIDVELVTTSKFIILSIATFGVYNIWWMYKTWKVFKEKDGLGIMPAGRAIFALFFAWGLFDKIQNFSIASGYTKKYSSGLLFVGYLFCNFLARLPDPYWLVSFCSIFFLVPPHAAFNYAIENSNNYNGLHFRNFNKRQWVLIVLGMFLFFVLLIGFIVPDVEYLY